MLLVLKAFRSQLISFQLVLLDAAKRDNIAGYKKFVYQSENLINRFFNWVSGA